MKKLRLSTQNKYIFGFFGGLGEYFNVDPMWLRFAFILLFSFNRPSMMLYLIGSLVVGLNQNK